MPRLSRARAGAASSNNKKGKARRMDSALPFGIGDFQYFPFLLPAWQGDPAQVANT